MKLDPTIFTELGVTLPAHQTAAFTQHFTNTLNERIGFAISELLDDDELNELLDLQTTASDKTVVEWIQAHVPDYDEVIQDEFDILMGEVADQAVALSA